LLDTNVLIALADESHTAHGKVRRWFRTTAELRWATCPLTEAGFVRVVCNPRYQEPAVDPDDARAMLGALTALPGHQFWPIDFGFEEAVAPFAERFFGHLQVTDVYLLALAIGKRGKLVTLDRGLTFLAGDEFAQSVVRL
jgi:uncharacterized protein